MGRISDNLTEDLMYFSLEYLVVNKKATRTEIWEYFKNDPLHPLFTKRDIFECVTSHVNNHMAKVSDLEKDEYEIVQRGVNTYINAKNERERIDILESLDINVANSTISNNYWQKRVTVAIGAFTLISTIVSIFTYFKVEEKLSKPLQELKEEIRLSRNQQILMHNVLESVNSSIQRINADTTFVKVVGK